MEPRTRLLGNRYELLSLIATGGMGQVWRGRDTLLQRQVAVKVLRSELTGDPSFLARFRAEAQHAALLTHPNIASVFDYGEVPAADGGEHLAYLVMELVQGETLSALLAREGRLDVARALGIVRQTAAALAAAHAAGVVHRDVKPGNVLIGPDGVVKITDFGIAWSASSVALTQTGQVLGTAHYLSPEQAQGGKAGPASDVYALGAVAYECLAGRRAFEGESSVQIALKQIREHPEPLPADIPEGVRRLVERALAKDPAERFPDGAALRDAVDAVAAGRDLPEAATAVLSTPRAAAGPAATAVLPLPTGPATAPGVPPGAGAASAVGARAGLAPAGRRMALGALAALLTLGVLAVIAVALFRPGPDAPATGGTAGESAGRTAAQSTSRTVEQTTPPAITLVAGNYLGRPVAEVQGELTRMGLQVRLAPVETTAVPAGRVTALDPFADLAPGQLVTVSHSVAPPPAVEEVEEDEDEDAEEPEETEEAKPGNGNGRGKGNDKGNDKD